MKIISVVGARPNFIKIAPFQRYIQTHNQKAKLPYIEHVLVHTGQHYDDAMSEAFFRELNITQADINLNIGSGSHAEQIGKTMIAFEKILETEKPDWVVVVGDVNATLACAVPTKKLGINLCHIEAGLRSNDMDMPEEINRIVTDRLSDLLLTPDRISITNLKEEGVDDSRISFVGNIMIDTLEKQKEIATNLNTNSVIKNNLLSPNLQSEKNFKETNPYCIATLHRPSNVDNYDILKKIINFLTDVVAKDMHLLWPIHPRTLKNLQNFQLFNQLISSDKIILLQPLGYNSMLKLNMGASIMLTDSGGLQEECTVLGTPCITMRWNTERPITLIEHGGTCHLSGNDIQLIEKIYHEYKNKKRQPSFPELWDGNTAQRCVNAILNYQNNK